MRTLHRFSPATVLLSLAALVVALAAIVPTQAQLPDFGGFRGLGNSPAEPDVQVSAQFTPATNDRPAVLFVTADLPRGFHIYAVDQGKLPDGGGPQPTKLTIAGPAGVRLLGPFQPLAPPQTHVDREAFVGLELREHEGSVTWFAPVELPSGADPASLSIDVLLDSQICDANNCIPVEREVTAGLGKGFPLPPGAELVIDKSAAESPSEMTAKTPGERSLTRPKATSTSPESPQSLSIDVAPIAGGPKYDISQISLGETAERSLVYYLLSALVGGIILNVMPCVLPVIGLKVMSFVQQAGESRTRALLLNVWYSLGIVSVFLALAALAVIAQVGWGDQFASTWFNVTLVGIVFAMALSLLGVWEIPIPGFVGSGAALDLAEKEGPAAAFLKGILTTLLATPCTAPLMASALAWAVRQPGWVTFSVFGAMGLGMASPYLLVGAFPSLIRFLPKPGMWMETFKKMMGLVLLCTVVWILSYVSPPLVVPTVAFMVAIGAACWWVARTPNYEPLGKRMLAWTQALMFVGVAAMGCYGLLYERVMRPRYDGQIAEKVRREVVDEKVALLEQLAQVDTSADLQQVSNKLAASLVEDGAAWQPFDLQRLGSVVLGDRKTVLVDFTADWCWNCKVLENTVLKSEEVEQALRESGVVTMTADYTEKPQWLKETIRALDANGVPITAIFPADRPYHPIVLRGVYTKATLLEHLQSLEPTRTASLSAVGR